MHRRPRFRTLGLVLTVVASLITATAAAGAAEESAIGDASVPEIGLDTSAPQRDGEMTIFTDQGERPATPGEQVWLDEAFETAIDGAARRSATASQTVNGITVNFIQSVPNDVRNATLAAAGAWGAALSPRGPITVNFLWQGLNPGVLGAAGPSSFSRYNTIAGQVWVPDAVANHQEGRDVDTDRIELEMVLSSSLYNNGWCTSIDGSDCNFRRISLYDTILHEFAHGLGLLGTGGQDGNGNLVVNTDQPDLYDTHVRVGPGTAAPLLIEVANPGAQLVGNNLFMRTLNDQFFRLHAPASFQPGSSYAHLDENTYDTQLLTPSAANGEFTGILDSITMDVMRTVGWSDRIVDGRTRSSVAANQCAANNPTLGSSGGPFAAQVASDVHQASIWRLYSAIFLRQPDNDGFAYWNSLLNPAAGGSTANYFPVADFFTVSDEFMNTYGNLDDRLFIDRLYCNVFSRLADDAGRQYWLNLLRTGQLSRGGVIIFWADSEEFRLRTGVTLLR